MDELSHNDISMENLKTSIVNAIKAIRPPEKHEDDVMVYKFVKNELHLITDTNINNTLKILSKMRRIENKPSKDNSSISLVTMAQLILNPTFSTIMDNPLVKTSLFADILCHSVEHHINSFVSSDTENDNNNLLEKL